MSDQGPPFSDWRWSKEHEKYYCYRYNAAGQPEYWWADETGPRVVSNSEPRTVTAGLQQSPGSAPPAQFTQADQPNYTATSSPQAGQYSVAYSQPTQTAQSSYFAASSPQAGQYSVSHSRTTQPAQSSYVATSSPQASQYSVAYSQTTQPAQPSYFATSSLQAGQYSVAYSQTPQPAQPNYVASYSSQAGQYSVAHSQTPQTQPSYRQTYESHSSYDQTPSQQSHDQLFYSPAAQSGQLTSQATAAQDQTRKRKRHIKIDPNAVDAESLDPRYRKVSSGDQRRFFSHGRVFATLWTEPSGSSSPGHAGHSSYSKVRFDETVFTEIRRFVVFLNKGNFSQCVPIQTYGGKGTLKQGIIVKDHAMIYCGETDKDEPRPLPGERLVKNALRVKPIGGYKLDAASRINFGKIYTVEHNIKVMRIGEIDKDHLVLLTNYVKAAGESESGSAVDRLVQMPSALAGPY